MFFNRIEAKARARMAMQEHRSHPMFISLGSVLLIFAVSMAIVAVAGKPYMQLLTLLGYGYSIQEAAGYLFRSQPGAMSVFTVLYLLLAAFSEIISFGFTSYCLKVSRREEAGFGSLLEGFARPVKVIGLRILIGFFTLLWTLPFNGPLLVLANYVQRVTNEMTLFILSIVMEVLSMMGSAVSLVVGLRYGLSTFFLLDDPDCSAREAMRRSADAMRGHKWELFVLQFSFFGWLFVGAFTVGILYLWLFPYMEVTTAIFYDYAAGSLNGERSSGEYAGPNYDYRPSDGPEPF